MTVKNMKTSHFLCVIMWASYKTVELLFSRKSWFGNVDFHCMKGSSHCIRSYPTLRRGQFRFLDRRWQSCWSLGITTLLETRFPSPRRKAIFYPTIQAKDTFLKYDWNEHRRINRMARARRKQKDNGKRVSGVDSGCFYFAEQNIWNCGGKLSNLAGLEWYDPGWFVTPS